MQPAPGTLHAAQQTDAMSSILARAPVRILALAALPIIYHPRVSACPESAREPGQNARVSGPTRRAGTHIGKVVVEMPPQPPAGALRAGEEGPPGCSADSAPAGPEPPLAAPNLCFRRAPGRSGRGTDLL